MKLLRLVPLFILLVTMVSLIPSTHATNNSIFNTYQVISPITLMARQSLDVTLTISWMAGGMPANPTPTFDYFTFSAPSSIAQTFPQGAPRLVITAAAPDSATVQLTGQLTDNGKTSPIHCNQQVTLQYNVPVQVGCIIFSVMLPPGACSRLFLPQCPPVDNNVRLTVQITNTS
ncbi:MAG TPA: hypothetical protein VK503_10345 [Candidatus Bathyarchaeia archaeon]|nr:hypothetical protein [Candidatus Bathyarchaeia archaeon]